MRDLAITFCGLAGFVTFLISLYLQKLPNDLLAMTCMLFLGTGLGLILARYIPDTFEQKEGK